MLKLTDKEWEKVDTLVEKLDISIAEAIEMLQEDKEIDRDKKLVKLDNGLEAGAKKARRAERSAPVRKEDVDKTELMAVLTDALTAIGITPNRTKPGEMMFEHNERRFKIVLSAPRT